MKAFKYTLLVVALTLSLGQMAYAREGKVTSNSHMKIGQERADRPRDFKGERAEVKLDNQAGTRTRRLGMVAKFARQMTRVHQANVRRLTRLADRIDSRIKKDESEKHVDLSVAKAKMVTARADIAAAQSYLNSIAAQVTAIIGNASTTPRAALQSVKDLFAASRENLKTAHQALDDVISSIEMGLGLKEDEEHATSTKDHEDQHEDHGTSTENH